MAEWRNWQTHQTQNLAKFTLREGSTPSSATNQFNSSDVFSPCGLLALSWALSLSARVRHQRCSCSVWGCFVRTPSARRPHCSSTITYGALHMKLVPESVPCHGGSARRSSEESAGSATNFRYPRPPGSGRIFSKNLTSTNFTIINSSLRKLCDRESPAVKTPDAAPVVSAAANCSLR